MTHNVRSLALTGILAVVVIWGGCGKVNEAPVDDGGALADASKIVDANSTLEDARITEVDAMLPVDVGPVDCRVTSDCLATSCRVADPGGTCAGCLNQTQCSSSFSCGGQATCERICGGDSDCNLGKTCSLEGRCTPRICGDSELCPFPYECNMESSRCERPHCDTSGSTICPAGFSCGTASFCIENELQGT